MFFPYVSYKYKKIMPEPKLQSIVEIPIQTDYIRSGCIICNYIVVSPHCKCLHNYCDYCITYTIFYKNNKCVFCV